MQGGVKREREWLAQACCRKQSGGERVKASVTGWGSGASGKATGDHQRQRLGAVVKKVDFLVHRMGGH